MTTLLIALLATLVPAAVLLIVGFWMVRNLRGDVGRGIGVLAIVLGLLLVILSIVLIYRLTTSTTVIHVSSTVEVSGVPVRLEEITITPAEVTALILVDRTPEQRQIGLKPRYVVLDGPWGWPPDRPLPNAYVVTTLGDLPDTFLARFHFSRGKEERGEWILTVENLRGFDDFELIGSWKFHFKVP